MIFSQLRPRLFQKIHRLVRVARTPQSQSNLNLAAQPIELKQSVATAAS
jgi:hypothetical protein